MATDFPNWLNSKQLTPSFLVDVQWLFLLPSLNWQSSICSACKTSLIFFGAFFSWLVAVTWPFFSLSLLPSSFAFLAFFFSFAGHLVDFILVGKFFGKAFRIVGLDEREGRLRWVVKKDFHGNFWVNVTWFLPFSPVSLTESCSFWYGLNDLFTLHKLADKVVWDH